MSLLLETNLGGDLVVDLDLEGSPILCKNILKLAKIRYYTSTLLYNVQSTRFCQGGDPTGTGKGGACIHGVLDTDSKGKPEEESSKRFLSSSLGRRLTPEECREPGRLVALELDGKADTVGSQFLITLGKGRTGDGLDEYFTSSGQERNPLSLGTVTEDDNGVLEKIQNSYCDSEGRPYADIRIVRMLVLHDPFPDPPGLIDYMKQLDGMELLEQNNVVVSSPNPSKPVREIVAERIAVDELDLRPEGEEETEEQVRARLEQEAKQQEHQRAVVLELLGDLPSAELKAPDDVLFICKLNPITEDEDLELIFSRFDPKCKVEIIRDSETGKSLQYAFCEFSNKQQCVEAYFKMNNALVDDRRIKVDFSQSVAKLWNKHTQKLRMPKEPYDRNNNSSNNNKRGHYNRNSNNSHGDRNQDNRQNGRPHHGRGDDYNRREYGNRGGYDRNRRERSPSDRDRSHNSERRRGPDEFGRSRGHVDDSREDGRRRDGEDTRKVESYRGDRDEHHRHRHDDQLSDDNRSSSRRSHDKEEKSHRKRSRDRRHLEEDASSYEDERKKKKRKKHSKEEKRKRKRHKDRHRYADDGTDDDEQDGRRSYNDREEGRKRHRRDDKVKQGDEHKHSDNDDAGVSSRGRHERNQVESEEDEKSKRNKPRSGRRERDDDDDADLSPREKLRRGHGRSAREEKRSREKRSGRQDHGEPGRDNVEGQNDQSEAQVEKPDDTRFSGSEGRRRHGGDRDERRAREGESHRRDKEKSRSRDDRRHGDRDKRDSCKESDRYSRHEHRRRHDRLHGGDERRHHKHDDEYRRRH